MKEKRTLKRRALVYQLEVLDVESGDVLGRLVDITAEGILLVSPKPGATGGRHRVRMEFPEDVFGRSRVEFAVEAAWSRPDANPSLFLSGYRISEASADDVEAIVGLIARHRSPA